MSSRLSLLDLKEPRESVLDSHQVCRLPSGDITMDGAYATTLGLVTEYRDSATYLTSSSGLPTINLHRMSST